MLEAGGLRDRLLSALFASVLFTAVIAAAGRTMDLGVLRQYGLMGLLSMPLFMGAGALTALALGQLPPASRNLSAMAIVPILVGLKVTLDGWFFPPVWETRPLFLAFVAANALAFAWLWFESL